MAIVLERTQADNPSAGSSRNVNITTAPTEGNYQLLYISVNSGSSSRVSSISQTNCTWTKITESYNSSGSIGMEAWGSVAGASAGSSITINFAASLTSSVIYAEYSGVDTSNPINGSGTSIDSKIGAPL